MRLLTSGNLISRSLALVVAVMLAVPLQALPCVCAHPDPKSSSDYTDLAEVVRSCCSHSAHERSEHDGGPMDSGAPDHDTPCGCPPECLSPCCVGKVPCTAPALDVTRASALPSAQLFDLPETIHFTPSPDGLFRPPRR